MMQQQLEVENNVCQVQEFEDVNLVCGVCETAAVITPLTGGFSPPVSRKPTVTDASDLQSKPSVCVCVCFLFIEVSTVYPLCLST